MIIIAKWILVERKTKIESQIIETKIGFKTLID